MSEHQLQALETSGDDDALGAAKAIIGVLAISAVFWLGLAAAVVLF